MTLRERILSVYRGQTPDVVPFMLDLSHWFYHKHGMPWDLSRAYDKPESELIDYHKAHGIGFYMPNLASLYSASYANGVFSEITHHASRIMWSLSTPLGSIERERVWHEQTYAWAMSSWGVKSEHDLRVLGYAMSGMEFAPHWDRYQAWADYVGDHGVVYMPAGYSAMGQLLHYWMGVEGTMYAIYDWPETMHEVVDQINESNLRLVDLLASSPAEIIIMGDNISADVQPASFFDEWSRPYYVEAIRRLHAAGKYVAVHIDGKLKGALRMIRDTGADCADAVTPIPMGDLTPEECRAEAGSDFILSGGVSPDLWLPNVSTDDFKAAVIRWVDLRKLSPRLIANAGDQVPPGALEDRIEIMRDLVETHGRFY
ncbi:MAG TPA: uroporphyrinogen decarboxylase family protein [Armatimonadota bacterium]|nr:uroporphyrinogen decarboxylase family protein [Armatimonadota bacterium]